MSDASSYQSGNTIDSINNTISGNAEEVRGDLKNIQNALNDTYNDLQEMNGRLDSYMEQYNIDKDNYNHKIDLIGDTFKYYTPTTKMQDEIEKSKQDALNKAADDAANKVKQNNEGFIKPWFLEITGQAKKDREAAIAAANAAYNNAVAQAAKDA